MKMPSPSPELRLLLLASRYNPQLPGIESITAAVAAVTDWPAFFMLVDRHRVAGLVYRCFNGYSSQGGELATGCLEGLRSRVGEATRKSLLQVAELRRISDRLRQQGIACLGYKGPVLAVQAYGELGLRHAGDLDLVVAEDDVTVAGEQLVELGYRRCSPGFSLTARQEKSYRVRYADFAYRHRDHPLIVELHWRFFYNARLFPLDSARVLADSKPLEVAGTTVAAMERSDLVLLLCVHGAKHGWFRLFWLADIDALMQQCELREQRGILHKATEMGVQRMVLQALLLSHRLYQTPLDEQVLAVAERDAAVERLVATAWDAINAPEQQWSEQGGRSLRKVMAMQVYLWRLRTGWHYRLREFAGTLVQPQDWHRLPLPDALFFLYMPLRLLLRLWPKRGGGR